MFFSIIIPTYNRAHFLPRTIESLLNQSFEDYEVLVVDNDSHDDTEALLQELCKKDRRIRYYKNLTNMGRSYSRNRGVTLASGQYLTFLDSDDCLLPHALNEAYLAIACERPALLHCRSVFVDTDHKVVYRPRLPDTSNQHKSISQGNYLSCIGTFIQAEVAKKYNFDESRRLVGSEDYLYWLEVLSVNRLRIHDVIVGEITVHDERTLPSITPELIEWQREYILHCILSSQRLLLAYGDYLPGLNSTFMLWRATATIKQDIYKAVCILARAIVSNPEILLWVRTYSIVVQIMKSFSAKLKIALVK